MHCAQEDRSVWIREDGGNSSEDDGLFCIPTGTYNRWWREIETQKVHRGERGRIRGKRCVFSTTCRLDRQPSCGQWGECSHRPRSALTQTNDKSALALYCNNTLSFHSTDCTYHTDQNARARTRRSAPRASVSHFATLTHTHIRTHWEKLNKCGNRCPTSDCSCPLLPVRLQRDRGIPLTKIRCCNSQLSLQMAAVNTHAALIVCWCPYH